MCSIFWPQFYNSQVLLWGKTFLENILYWSVLDAQYRDKTCQLGEIFFFNGVLVCIHVTKLCNLVSTEVPQCLTEFSFLWEQTLNTAPSKLCMSRLSRLYPTFHLFIINFAFKPVYLNYPNLKIFNKDKSYLIFCVYFPEWHKTVTRTKWRLKIWAPYSLHQLCHNRIFRK